MKPIEDRSYSVSEGPMVRLYRNEIEYIIDEMKRSHFSVSLKDSSHEFDDLDDIQRNIGDEISELDIEGKGEGDNQRASIKVELRRCRKPKIMLRSYTPATIVLSQKILERMTTCQSPMHGFLNPWMWWAVVAASQFFMLIAFATGSAEAGIFIAYAISGPSLFMWLTALIFAKRFPRIRLIRMHQDSTFWSRHADSILFHMVTFALGAVMPMIWNWVSSFLSRR